jgi:hypothetical protein
MNLQNVTVTFPTKEDDDVCRICFDWCTDHSSCSNRYHQLQGEWVDTPLGGVGAVGDAPDVVPICDNCYERLDQCYYDPAHGPVIDIHGHKFDVDCDYRMND